jgi:signal transduction histidine kinase
MGFCATLLYMKVIEKTVLLPVIVVFSAVMTVVIISFFMSLSNTDKELNKAAQDYANETTSMVQDRLNIFEETLRAGVGLFSGTGSVSKEQFSNFINTSAVLERYSGAQVVGYVKVVPDADLADFTRMIQTTSTPNFKLYPEGSRSVYTPIIYTEPQSDTNKRAIGFDPSSDPIRLHALEVARDSGKVTLSSVVQSVSDKTQNGHAFILYAPQYKQGMPTGTVEQRRAAIEGYMFTGFRIAQFMENVLPADKDQNISFKVTVGNDKVSFYTAPDYDRLSARDHTQVDTDSSIGNNVLHFSFIYDRNSQLASNASRPVAILIFGFVTAVLIAGAVWLILRGKANELLLEQERGINEAKDNLLSLASHQLRTPATGVKQYLGLLLQGFAGTLTNQQKQLLEKAYAGNERQLKTINDVLYLARLGSGRIVLSKSTFSVEQLIRDIVHELHDEIVTKKHKVTIKTPKRHQDFYGDAHMMRMAIENLLTNAIKYTHPGGKIVVTLQNTKDQLKITVEDNGIGIEQSQQDRLFEQFERIDNDLSIAVGGSGIGLYVVRNIAGMHDGHVEVTSALDQGSRFTMVVPRRASESEIT